MPKSHELIHLIFNAKYAHWSVYAWYSTEIITCVKRPLSKRQEIGFHDHLSLNAGQKYCRILSTFIKLPFVIKIFVLSIFEWPFFTGFTVELLKTYAVISNAHLSRVCKRGKLSGSCLSTLNGFGSTQLPIFLCHIRVPTFSSQNNKLKCVRNIYWHLFRTERLSTKDR